MILFSKDLSYHVSVGLFPRSRDCLGLANISFTHLVARLSRLVLVLLLSHRLCEFCYFLTVCVSMVLDLVIEIVRGLHSQSIAQTGCDGSESGEVCVYIIFNRSCDFISKKNELISDCFCILFVLPSFNKICFKVFFLSFGISLCFEI